MTFQELKSIFQTDFHLSDIQAMQQNWSPKLTGVDLTNTPRCCFGLLLITDYAASYTLPDGSTLNANVGDIVLLPKGGRYCVRFSVPPDGISHPLLINFRLLCSDGTEPSPDFSAIHLCKDDGTLLPLFSEATTLCKSGGHPAQLKAAVYRLISLLFPLHQKDNCCIGYINSHFTEQFSIPQLAKQCALSESVFRRRFRQLTGQSPIQYINRLKIEKACQLLLSGDISTEDISDFLGFYSVSYFYRVFKSATGCTPNEYRNSLNYPPTHN